MLASHYMYTISDNVILCHTYCINLSLSTQLWSTALRLQPCVVLLDHAEALFPVLPDGPNSALQQQVGSRVHRGSIGGP